MKTIRAHNEIELSNKTAFHGHLNALFSLDQLFHTITEDRFNLTIDLTEDQVGEVCARKTDVAIAGLSEECINWKACHLFASGIDHFHLFKPITSAANVGDNTHPLSNVKACTPEIDDITSGSQPRGRFNDGWCKPVMQ